MIKRNAADFYNNRKRHNSFVADIDEGHFSTMKQNHLQNNSIEINFKEDQFEKRKNHNLRRPHSD